MTLTGPDLRLGGDSSPAIATAWHMRLSVYLCPADPARPDQGAMNSAGNRGVGYDLAGALDNGLFVHPTASLATSTPSPGIGPAAIRDGLSQTAAFSEWLIGAPTRLAGETNRSTYLTSIHQEPADFGRFMSECDSPEVQVIPFSDAGKGLTWMHGDLKATLYNHGNGPNRRSCSNGGLVQKSAWTAGGLHGGGVNTLMVDGRVTFVKDAVALPVWRALGTRNGGDVADVD
ncbi:hypothetical protein VT85_07720 [Planctomyces sp. SH-PL62]|nr:hypothetical protein VT85_07720 [Planctomyces sp. SH-PL62]